MSTNALSPAAVVEELSDFERGLKALVTQEDAPDGFGALAERAAETRDRILELWQEGVRLELTDELRSEMLEHCLSAVTELGRAAKSDGEPARHLVALALVDLEALRHILRDAIDHEPLRTLHQDDRVFLSRADAVRHLEQWFPRLSREQQATILGVTDRQVLRWSDSTDTPATRHADIAVELAGVLRHSWTDEGVLRWFERPHPMLGDRKPADVIDDVDLEVALRDAARTTRAQTAT